MHYSRHAFAIDDEEDTITPYVSIHIIHPHIVPYIQYCIWQCDIFQNPPDAEIGQRVFISDIDIAKLKLMYECPE